MTTHVYVLMSENFAGHSFPIASYIYEADADFVKMQKELSEHMISESFKRYYKIVKVPLFNSINDQRIT